MKVKYLWSLCILLIEFGCKNKPNSAESIVYSTYVRNSENSSNNNLANKDTFRFFKNQYIATYIRGHNENNSILKGELIGKLYGHYFVFDNSGKLRKYKFLVGDNKHHNYEITNINETYTEIGVALIDYWRIEDSITNPERKVYTLVFSNFPRTHIIVLLSTDGKEYKKVEIRMSKLLPYLSEFDFVKQKLLSRLFIKVESDSLIVPLRNLIPNKTTFDTLNFN